MRELDARDQRLLALLRANARISVVDIAKNLGSDVQQADVRAFMSISADSTKERKIVAALRGNPHVAVVHHTTGRWDLIAEIQTDSLSSFNTIVGALRLIDGVTATETNLLLDSYE